MKCGTNIQKLLKNIPGKWGTIWGVLGPIGAFIPQWKPDGWKGVVLARILHEGGFFGCLDVMGHFAAHIRDGDWPELAWESAPERLTRSRESVFEPWRRWRA